MTVLYALLQWPQWRPLLLGLWLMVAIFAGSHALLTKRNASEAWGWIAVCWLFPFAGPALYFLLGINRLRTRARDFDIDRRARDIGTAHASDIRNTPPAHPPVPLWLEEVARTADVLTRRPLLGGNAVCELHSGEAAYPRMLAAIAAAQHSVWLASYIFDNDALGKQFAAALIAAHQRGVQVCVLIDDVGERYSLFRIGSVLHAHGVALARFNPLRLLPPKLHLNLRNHRKLLLIDSRIGFTGGMNIIARHLVADPRIRHPVADIHFELQGPIVRQMGDVFIEDWAFAAKRSLDLPDVENQNCGPAIARVITDGPNEDIDQLNLVLQAAVAAAKHELLIMTPYFLPPPELLAALQGAALRGVRVLVLLPANNNLRYVDWATRHLLPGLLERGVQVAYQPGPFCHSKLVVVDGAYALIGSANWDPRSLLLNFEMNAEIYDAAFAQRLSRHFHACWQNSRPLDLQTLRRARLPVRLRDAICWLFSPYL